MMRTEDPERHGKSHTGPFPYGFCGKERFEDTHFDIIRDARSGIPDTDRLTNLAASTQEILAETDVVKGISGNVKARLDELNRR